MDWKNFLQLSLEKIVGIILLILVLGVPATLHSCGTLLWELGESQNPCIDRFGLQPTLLIWLESMPKMDASTTFYFDPLVIGVYLIVLYLAACLIFHLAGYNSKKGLLFIVLLLIALILLSVVVAVLGSRSFT